MLDTRHMSRQRLLHVAAHVARTLRREMRRAFLVMKNPEVLGALAQLREAHRC